MSDTPRTDAAIDESVRGWSYQPLFDESRKLERELSDLRTRLAAAEKDAERYRWLPIETAPKNNECPLLLARFNDDGSLQSIDHDGTWTSERESWELPNVYYFWASANGYVEEPSHWMYQPSWYAAIEKERSRDC